MYVPRIPPKMIQVGDHWIMRMDDGVEESFSFSPDEIAEMNEAARLSGGIEPMPFPTRASPADDSSPLEPPTDESGTTI